MRRVTFDAGCASMREFRIDELVRSTDSVDDHRRIASYYRERASEIRAEATSADAGLPSWRKSG